MNAMPPPDLAQVQSLRARLWDSGYRPLPVYSINHPCNSPGKQPAGEGWQNVARRAPPPCVEQPPRLDASNTGILCDGLRAIDIDIDDADIAGRIKTLAITMLGDAPIRWRSNTGRALLVYRAAEGEPAKRTCNGKHGKIEVLGRGQQFVAFGLHPSGVPLQWAPEPLDQIPRDNLPAITEDALSGFLAAVAPMIGAAEPHATTRDGDGTHTPSPLGPSADPLDIIGALAVIPNPGRDWDTWARVGLATWAASGGSQEGFNAWSAWSSRCAAEGVHDHDACGRAWRGFTQTPPGEIGFGSLAYLAREARPGWQKPSLAKQGNAEDAPAPWGEPDMTVLRMSRRPPPEMPLDVFGPRWSRWISEAADAAATAPDYVAVALLASASALVGHARWAQAVPGWSEPPHLWLATVGDSGTNKSAAADALQRHVLPTLENRMLADFPDRLAEWRAKAEEGKARIEAWQQEVRRAQKDGLAPPAAPTDAEPAEPQAPRLVMSDATIEKVAATLADAAPKGLVIARDELAGWLLGMTNYNDAGRQFWLEAHGGRPFRVDRQKHAKPLIVPRLAVAVMGSTQPEKIATMFREADDGLLARFAWAWPDQRPFRLSRTAPELQWATAALDRLRMLDLTRNEEGDTQPVYVPLEEAAIGMMERFGQDMQARQQEAGGLLRSAYGKARGLALRLSLVLTMLRWCGQDGYAPPPGTISEDVLGAACDLVADYFMPMAERVYGDAAATTAERNAATLARWIRKAKPDHVHIRSLLRDVRLPGLTNADAIRDAAEVLIEAEWLRPPPRSTQQGRAKVAFPVNPALLDGDL